MLTLALRLPHPHTHTRTHTHTATGIMKANMFVILIAAPINIFLQWLLVWSRFSIGPIGAAVATSITNLLLPLLSILYIAFIDGSRAWGGWSWAEALSLKDLAVILRLGIPGAAMICTEWWAFEIVALLAGLLGEQALASQTVILSTSTLTYAIPLGISIASSTWWVCISVVVVPSPGALRC
jgi:MATE family multidrug resistance protein